MLKYSETFFSIQGEGKRIGELCSWIRLFGCNLTCSGFGQTHPGEPSTWQKLNHIKDARSITRLEDVPTPPIGCDSSYAWAKQFEHLAKENTHAALIESLLAMRPLNRTYGHVFTGGEPLLQFDQVIDFLDNWAYYYKNTFPSWITVETNGTIKPKHIPDKYWYGVPFTYSISPKLYHVSGEPPERAINYEALNRLAVMDCYFKFVLNEDQRAWDQAKNISDAYPEVPVFVMPVGGVHSQQTDSAVKRIADKAIFEYGWNVSPRAHVLIWGDDQIGR